MIKKLQKNTQQNEIPTLLIILDGFGLRDPKGRANAITPETAPNIFGYMKDYSFGKLKAHGTDVGLFPGQEGNSEAGHFNIGAGRIVKQDLVRITESINDGTFFKNEAFEQAYFHAKKYKTSIHLMGLLTDGQSAHANPEHLYALLKYLKNKKAKNIYLHLFTDGRDSPPHQAVSFLKKLRKKMTNDEQIATISGRFYGMDRNKLWDRTKVAYDMMVQGKSTATAESAEEAISQAYNRNETDEYISPTVITKNKKPISTIKNNDVIFFFNSRSDRARQITKAFVQPDFQKKNQGAFRRVKRPKNIRFVAMTDFGPDLPDIFTAFPSPDITNSLPCAIGDKYKQLYISESEKYAHITYFINGGYASPICGEKRILVRSSDIKNFKDMPAMNAKEITNVVIDNIRKNVYNFVAINFPNADIVGHTGDLLAGKKAISSIDKQVKRLVDTLLKKDGQILITADHGNAEVMENNHTGEIMTEHTTNPVPCIIIGKNYKNKKLKNGRLSDISPTLLKMMGLNKPKEMTGKALF